MSYDIVHEKSIEILTDWVEKKNHSVELQNQLPDQLSYEDKTIYIHTRQGLESQVYSLLHECGHLLIYLDNKSFEQLYVVEKVVEKSSQLNYKWWHEEPKTLDEI